MLVLSNYQCFLIVLLISSGSINLMCIVWLNAAALHSNSKRSHIQYFKHPFLQAWALLFSESLCLIIFNVIYYVLKHRQEESKNENSLVKGNRNFKAYIYVVPAMCNMVSKTLTFISLSLTITTIVFYRPLLLLVALLSVIFLQRSLGRYEWSGFVILFLGTQMLVTYDFIEDTVHSAQNSFLGVLLILLAQLLKCFQLVHEEQFVARNNIPALQAVGYQGLFGFICLGILLVPLHFIKTPSSKCIAEYPNGAFEDIDDAISHLNHNWQIMFALFTMIISKPFYIFGAISVTKEMSAMARVILDTGCIIFAYIFVMICGWQNFHVVQLLGVATIIGGIFYLHPLWTKEHEIGDGNNEMT